MVAAFVLALAASVALLVVPTYTTECLGVAEYGGSEGTQCPEGTTHETLLAASGPHVLWLLAAPPMAVLVALIARRRIARVLAAVLLVMFVLITGFSIGDLYLPAAIAMAVSARR